ncbi:MAG TPA: circadian clock KaiB family protein [Opitutus sp.]|nr:circadian clock KaiB family protein [Opitutus sp.]
MTVHPKVSASHESVPGDTAVFEALLRRRRGERYVLTLYITGSSPRSLLAIGNIRALCDEFLPNRYELEVVDIYQQPATASHEQIVAAPTLVKHIPKPVRRLVGDLSSRERILEALSIRPVSVNGKPGKSTWLEL